MNIIDKILPLVKFQQKTMGIFFSNRQDAEDSLYETINNRSIRKYVTEVSFITLSFTLGDCSFRFYYSDIDLTRLKGMQFTEVIFDDHLSQEFINTILPFKRG